MERVTAQRIAFGQTHGHKNGDPGRSVRGNIRDQGGTLRPENVEERTKVRFCQGLNQANCSHEGADQ